MKLREERMGEFILMIQTTMALRCQFPFSIFFTSLQNFFISLHHFLNFSSEFLFYFPLPFIPHLIRVFFYFSPPFFILPFNIFLLWVFLLPFRVFTTLFIYLQCFLLSFKVLLFFYFPSAFFYSPSAFLNSFYFPSVFLLFLSWYLNIEENWIAIISSLIKSFWRE